MNRRRITDIRIPDRRQRREERDISALAESIARQGLINPVTLSSDGTLVSGLHRLRACQSLGWEEIPVTIVTADDLNRKLIEIDENLIRNELTALEHAEHVAERKRIYDALHPGAHRPKGGRRRNSEIISPFSKDTANKMGTSIRTVQHEVQIATKIPSDLRDELRGTETADCKTDLLRLSRKDPDEQRRIIAKLKLGDLRDVRSAEVFLRIQDTKALQQGRDPQPGLVTDLSTAFDKYRCILADPPWEYDKSFGRGAAAHHYPTMTAGELCALPVCDLASSDGCMLWLWATWQKLADRAPHQLLESWGFRWVGVAVWNKLRLGKGDWFRSKTEPLILAVKGHPQRLVADQGNYFEAPRGAHSQKPKISYEIIERFCIGPRIELFSRRARPGWDRWGLEAPGDNQESAS